MTDRDVSPAFQQAVSRVVEAARRVPVAVMCAELHPSRCYRRLLGDAFLLHGISVAYLNEHGADRDFQFRRKDDFGKKNQNRTLQTVTLPLEHGSLLIMRHPTNRNWKHQLPKRTGKTTEPGARLNLTWRTMYR